MNNPIKPITNQNISLKGIKVITIAITRIIDMSDNKSCFMSNILTQILKEYNRRN